MWIVRSRQDDKISVTDRLNKPVQAKAAIGTAIQLIASNQKIVVSEFEKVVKEAHWYAVDVDAAIHSVFSEMKPTQLEKIKGACEGNKTLNWLLRKVEERMAAVKELESRLEDGVYSSAMLSCDGFPVNGPSQQGIWKELDQRFDSVGVCNLEAHSANAFSRSGPWKLLPFAELKLKGTALESRSLEHVCHQAWKKLVAAKTIDFKKLTDSELSRFLELAKHPELEHHAFACKAESERRAHIGKCERLAAYMEKRLSHIAAPSTSTRDTSQPLSEENPFEGLSDKDISVVTLRVLAKSSPTVVIKASNLDSSHLADMWLNEVAKAHLEKPSVALMDDAVLIEYLKSPTSAPLSNSARTELAAEADKRAASAYKDGYACLQAGLRSDSCNKLVRSVLEFSGRLEHGAELQRAAGLNDTSEELPKDFSKMLSKADETQLMRARHLAIDLIESKEKLAGARLSWAIRGTRSATALEPLSPQDKQFMTQALSQYITEAPPVSSQVSATATGVELGAKFLALFKADMLTDENFRRANTVDGKALPVCEQFIKDQRASNIQIQGRPVFNSHITSHQERAQNFVRQMRSLDRINEEQIMTASRIANQSTGAALIKLVRNERMFPLPSAEAITGGVPDVGLGLFPTGVDIQENFVSNRDGSLTVHVRIFNENTEKWSGTSRGPVKIDPITVETDPKQSSFSAELRFEIDTQGKIQEVIFENSVVERKFVPADS